MNKNNWAEWANTIVICTVFSKLSSCMQMAEVYSVHTELHQDQEFIRKGTADKSKETSGTKYNC